MSEEEKVRKMTKFKGILEKRIHEIETELDGLRTLLGFIDDLLLERGFKRAEIIKPESPSPTQEKLESPIPLKTITGDLLANLYIQGDSMRVVLNEEMEFNINTPPFTSFFVKRVLVKMQEKDRETMMRGEIPSELLSYDIKREGESIREITIRNITPERLRELRSTIRWTLEKMHEKAVRNA